MLGDSLSLRRLTGRGIFCILLLIFISPIALASSGVSIGAGMISFRDQEVSSTYGSSFGFSLAGELKRFEKMSVTTELSYIRNSHSPDFLPFIDDAEITMQFIPLRGRLLYEINPQNRFSLGVGPQIALALIAEKWQVVDRESSISTSHQDRTIWLGIGAASSLRVKTGGTSSLGMTFEWMWSYAERETVPGNSNQTRDMTGGWIGMSLLWTMPW